MILGFGFRVQGSGFRVQGSGFRVQDARFRERKGQSKREGGGERDLDPHVRFRTELAAHVLCEDIEPATKHLRIVWTQNGVFMRD